MKKSRPSNSDRKMNFKGDFLIAMPGMGDPRFERSVIYVCTHSSAGAMGLIINKPLEDITFDEIIEQVDEEIASGIGSAPLSKKDAPIFRGGPVEQGRGFVLHSADYNLDTSQKVDDEVYLTASIEVLRDIARDSGPQNSLMALGYSGWAAGQLEAEMADNGWLTCKAVAEILFDRNPDAKYDRALALMGIDPAMLSSDAGHA